MLAILILLTLAILIITLVPSNTIINNKYTANFMILFLFIYVAILLVTKENLSIDMSRYVRDINIFSDLTLFQALNISPRESMFIIFQWIVAQISTDPNVFYLAIWIIFGTVLLFSLKKIFEPWQLLILFFCYLNFFIFFGYITNTVRQGLAIALIISAASKLLIKDSRSFVFYLSILAAPLIHITTLPLSLALFLIKKINFNLKVVLSFWLIFAILYVTGLNQTLFGQLSSVISDIEFYTSEATIGRYDGRVNRLDFLLFSSFWIFYALIALKKILNKDENYKTLVKIYIIFNIYFLSLGFIGYSDRLASYSWFFIPIIVLYPLFKSDKRRYVFIFLVVIIFVITSVVTGSLLYNQPILF